MKKIFLSVLVSGSTLCAFSQTTWDFESWNGTEPQGWISENELMIIGNPQSAFEETTPANVHGGAKALRLLSVTMTSPVTGLPNPIGLAAPGKLVGFAPKFGMPYTARPALVEFWYKYTPAANDTMEFLMFLWNSTTKDTLGFAYWKSGTAVSAYTLQSVAITYDSTYASELPDSMALTFSSTKLFNTNYTFCTNCGKAGSTLWLDDITFSGWNSVHEPLSSEGVTLFPNPARDLVNIRVDALNDACKVNAYNATGRLVSTAPLSSLNNGINGRSGVMNASGLSSGLYSYCILDKNGTSLRAGKFSVVH